MDSISYIILFCNDCNVLCLYLHMMDTYFSVWAIFRALHRHPRPSLTQLDLGRNKLTELDDISEFPGEKTNMGSWEIHEVPKYPLVMSTVCY